MAIPEQSKRPVNDEQDAQRALSTICDMVEMSTKLSAGMLGQDPSAMRGVTNLAMLTLGMSFTMKHPEYVAMILKLTKMEDTPVHRDMIKAILEFFPIEVEAVIDSSS